MPSLPKFKPSFRLPRGFKRLKCTTGNYQCGGRCQSQKFKCPKQVEGVPKSLLEWDKFVSEQKLRVENINQRRPGAKSTLVSDDQGFVSRVPKSGAQSQSAPVAPPPEKPAPSKRKKPAPPKSVEPGASVTPTGKKVAQKPVEQAEAGAGSKSAPGYEQFRAELEELQSIQQKYRSAYNKGEGLFSDYTPTGKEYNKVIKPIQNKWGLNPDADNFVKPDDLVFIPLGDKYVPAAVTSVQKGIGVGKYAGKAQALDKPAQPTGKITVSPILGKKRSELDSNIGTILKEPERVIDSKSALRFDIADEDLSAASAARAQYFQKRRESQKEENEIEKQGVALSEKLKAKGIPLSNWDDDLTPFLAPSSAAKSSAVKTAKTPAPKTAKAPKPKTEYTALSPERQSAIKSGDLVFFNPQKNSKTPRGAKVLGVDAKGMAQLEYTTVAGDKKVAVRPVSSLLAPKDSVAPTVSTPAPTQTETPAPDKETALKAEVERLTQLTAKLAKERNIKTSEMPPEYYPALRELQAAKKELGAVLDAKSEARRNSPEAIAEQEEFERKRAREFRQKEQEAKATTTTYERVMARQDREIAARLSNQSSSAVAFVPQTRFPEQSKPQTPAPTQTAATGPAPYEMTSAEYARKNYQKAVDKVIKMLQEDLKGKSGLTRDYRAMVNQDIAALKAVDSYESAARVVKDLGYDEIDRLAQVEQIREIKRNSNTPEDIKAALENNENLDKLILARRRPQADPSPTIDPKTGAKLSTKQPQPAQPAPTDTDSLSGTGKQSKLVPMKQLIAEMDDSTLAKEWAALGVNSSNNYRDNGVTVDDILRTAKSIQEGDRAKYGASNSDVAAVTEAVALHGREDDRDLLPIDQIRLSSKNFTPRQKEILGYLSAAPSGAGKQSKAPTPSAAPAAQQAPELSQNDLIDAIKGAIKTGKSLSDAEFAALKSLSDRELLDNYQSVLSQKREQGTLTGGQKKDLARIEAPEPAPNEDVKPKSRKAGPSISFPVSEALLSARQKKAAPTDEWTFPYDKDIRSAITGAGNLPKQFIDQIIEGVMGDQSSQDGKKTYYDSLMDWSKKNQQGESAIAIYNTASKMLGDIRIKRFLSPSEESKFNAYGAVKQNLTNAQAAYDRANSADKVASRKHYDGGDGIDEWTSAKLGAAKSEWDEVSADYERLVRLNDDRKKQAQVYFDDVVSQLKKAARPAPQPAPTPSAAPAAQQAKPETTAPKVLIRHPQGEPGEMEVAGFERITPKQFDAPGVLYEGSQVIFSRKRGAKTEYVLGKIAKKYDGKLDIEYINDEGSRVTRSEPQKNIFLPIMPLPKKTIKRLDDAIGAGNVEELSAILDPSNKQSRKRFENATGIKLPQTIKGTNQAIFDWAKSQGFNPPPAPEKPVSTPKLAPRAKKNDVFVSRPIIDQLLNPNRTPSAATPQPAKPETAQKTAPASSPGNTRGITQKTFSPSEYIKQKDDLYDKWGINGDKKAQELFNEWVQAANQKRITLTIPFETAATQDFQDMLRFGMIPRDAIDQKMASGRELESLRTSLTFPIRLSHAIQLYESEKPGLQKKFKFEFDGTLPEIPSAEKPQSFSERRTVSPDFRRRREELQSRIATMKQRQREYRRRLGID